MTALVRVNVGCGQTPTPHWINFDNSLSVRIAGSPLSRLLPCRSREFAEVARKHMIRHAPATRLPFASASVDVLYSSHMMEHLDQEEARAFLKEARRVLRPGGYIRLALPDLRVHVDHYIRHGDADVFVGEILMGTAVSHTLAGAIRRALVPPRHHLWMYDGPSACRRLIDAGFAEPGVLSPGQTTIPEPGMLDLAERLKESVYIEARA